MIATTLLSANTASQLSLIDEIEKAPRLGNYDRSSEILHFLFERQNARSFRDRNYDLPIRTDYIFWVATANDVAALPPSVLDRRIVMAIAPPERRGRLKLAAHIYGQLRGKEAACDPVCLGVP